MVKMERTHAAGVKPGKVLVKGWVDQLRNIGNLKFFRIRDRTGSVQVTLKKGETPERLLKMVDSLHREDCVAVMGKAKPSKVVKEGVEIFPEKIEIVSKAETPLPFETREQIKTGQDRRFDYRFMDIRNPKVQAIFRIKDVAIAGIRKSFNENGFIEVQTPVLQAAGAEGGATMFPVKYYGQRAYLRQSPQLYKQILMASGLDRVWEIGPAFRAEKFHTRRHVPEFLSVDFEMAWIKSEEDVMGILENMVVHSLKGIAKNCKEGLEVLGKKVKIPRLPLKRLTYSEVVKILKKSGTPIEWGEDLKDPQEKKLGKILAKKGIDWYYITKFPSKIKPFYIMFDGKISRGVDLDYKGMEMASGGQREHRYDVLVKVMKQKGLNPRNFKFYLDAFRYGVPNHGGIGFGIERMITKVLNLPDIKEAILFPRTPERLVP